MNSNSQQLQTGNTFRDTVYGQFIRIVTSRKYFRFPDEKDPDLWKKYLKKGQSSLESPRLLSSLVRRYMDKTHRTV